MVYDNLENINDKESLNKESNSLTVYSIYYIFDFVNSKNRKKIIILEKKKLKKRKGIFS